MQACDLLQGLIPNKDEKSNISAKHLERMFIFSLMWSLGALLELDDRARMEEFLQNHESKLLLPQIREGETIFEYVASENGM